MPSLLLSRRDLDFLLFEWLRTDSLTERTRYAAHSRYTFEAVLDLSEEVATAHFASHNKLNDAHEPTLGGDGIRMLPEVRAALDTYAETGLLASDIEEAFGGGQLPRVVSAASFAWFQAANIATAAYPFLTLANAHLLLAHGSQAQIEAYVPPMLRGQFFGTMCLSEPHAGSSLADVSTRALPYNGEAYRLFGNKMWISAGDHNLADNIIHLVLARIAGSPGGVKGLSLFIVPKYLVHPSQRIGERNDITLAGLNHKMGYRGTTNTVLNLGEGLHRPEGGPGAIGELVGEPNQGIKYMFDMMNEARVGVGLGAAALGYTGYLKSVDYARNRIQGRPIAMKDPSTPPVAIIEHPDVKRMLLAQKCYAEGALALGLYCSRLIDEERSAPTDDTRTRAKQLLDLLTPIAKSWPSQWCLEANNLAIQVHGGSGYTRDYDVEQHYRDNRLNAIHEGTHGIQGLDLLGRKVLPNRGAGISLLAAVVTTTVARAATEGGELSELGNQLEKAFGRLVAVTNLLCSIGDPRVSLANSTIYLEATGHVLIAWIWLEQACATAGKSGDFYDGKRQAARFFFRYELPKTNFQFDLLESLDMTTFSMQNSWF